MRRSTRKTMKKWQTERLDEEEVEETDKVMENMAKKRNSVLIQNPSDLATLLESNMKNGDDTSSKISDVPSVPSESSDSEDYSEDGNKIGKDP